jgi:hypothetical protein
VTNEGEESETEEKKDALVMCEECGHLFPGTIDAEKEIRAFGVECTQCCEGHGFREVKDDVPDEFAAE